MKILKYLFLTLFSLVLLLVLVVAGLLIFVSPNQFKGQIVQAVEEATGRHFEIQGPISWSFYPGFGLEVQGVVLSNPAGYSDSPLVAIEDAQVSLALWPLLSKEVQVQDIVVSGVQLHLIQKDAKANNWTFRPSVTAPTAVKSAPEKPIQNSPPAADKPQANANLPRVIHIHNIQIKNMRFSYLDLSSQLSLSFDQIDLSVREVDVLPQFDFQSATLSFQGHFKQPQGALVPIAGELRALVQSRDLDTQAKLKLKLSLNEQDLFFDAQLLSLMEPHLTFQGHFDAFELSNVVDLKGAQLSMQNAKLQGNLSASSLDPQKLLTTLNGEVGLQVDHIQLKGLDLGSLTQQLTGIVARVASGGVGLLANVTGLQQELKPLIDHGRVDPTNGEKTEFGQFKTVVKIKNGFLTQDKIVLQGGDFSLDGSGTLNLPKQMTADYNLFLKIQNSPDAVPIPVYAKGPLESLNYGVDTSALFSQLKKQFLSQLSQLKNLVPSSGSDATQPSQANSASVNDAIQQHAQKLLQHVFG